MSQMLSQLLSSLLPLVIGALITPFWNHILYPRIIQVFAERTKLHRQYVAELRWADVGTHKLSMSVKKVGYKVTGTLRFIEGKANLGKEYELKGRYYHGLLTFTFVAMDPASISQGSGAFNSKSDGEAFVGYLTYISQSNGEIEAIDCKFVNVLYDRSLRND